MMADDVVRAATEEMTKVCQEVYDRDGHVPTFVTAFCRRPARQIVAIVEEPMHIGRLAQFLTMALNAPVVMVVAEAFVKEWTDADPPDVKPGYLAKRADHDSSIHTEVIVTTMGMDRPGCWTDRSAPSLDEQGRRVWDTIGEADGGDGMVRAYLTWAADHPLPGGPLDEDDLDQFVKELVHEGLTPMACVVGGDDD